MEREKAIELGKYFFTDLRKEDVKDASTPLKIKVVDQLVKLNIESSTMMHIMADYSTHTNNIPNSIDDVMDLYRQSLTKPGVFYYHPRLQVSSPAPVLRQLDSGEFVEVDADVFFLRNTKIFTAKNAGEYFHYRMGTKSMIENRDIASINKLLGYCDDNLDLLLYTIDAAAAIIFDSDLRPPKSPVFLNDYITDGQGLLDDRITLCKAVGLTHECNC